MVLNRDLGRRAISVLMPAYNVESYIEQAIKSLQRQTFRDFELVVVDDGSTDCTPRMLAQMAAGDSRIRILSTARNLGVTAALNFGLSYCMAPYIARMDADDVAMPDRLQKQLAFLEIHPEVALVGCQSVACDATGRVLSARSSYPCTTREITQTLHMGSPCAHTWLARRAVYERLNGYRGFLVGQDCDFLLRAVTAGLGLANLEDVLMMRRLRPGQISETRSLQQAKLHFYCIRLFDERLVRGRDSFSLESQARVLRSNRLERVTHRFARRCMGRGFAARSMAGKLAWLALSALVSPWFARYYVDRARMRLTLMWLRRDSAATAEHTGQVSVAGES